MTAHLDTRTSQLSIIPGVRRIPRAAAAGLPRSLAVPRDLAVSDERPARREHRFGAAVGVVLGNMVLWGVVSAVIVGVLVVQTLIAGAVIASFFVTG